MSRPALRHYYFMLVLFAPWILRAQDAVDSGMVAAIRREVRTGSRIMESANQLTNVFGARLTGSPQLEAASTWAMTQLERWGARNVHREPWGPFGRGWTMGRFWMNADGPVTFPMIAYPEAWSSGTHGPLTADVVIFDAKDPGGFDKYRGKLAGKFILEDTVRALTPRFRPLANRLADTELLDLANADAPSASHGMQLPEFLLRKFKRDREVANFLIREKPAAILFRGDFGGERGVVFPDAALAYASDTTRPDWFMHAAPAYAADAGEIVPQILVSLEHYNRLYRLAKMGIPMKVTMDLKARYLTADRMSYNVIAEIPGSDSLLRREVVMLGAHLDSWHGATGATDNAAGCSVLMEVMRVLEKIYDETGGKPRRTIRLALWTGEEEGLLGSTAYVNEHFAKLDGPSYDLQAGAHKPDYENLSAYYNFDFGTGRIRGIYLDGNEAAGTVFRTWLEPFRSEGASTLSPGALGGPSGSDHMPFAAAGLPAFMFIQDALESRTLTHHSTMDEYDHLSEDDLKQAAEIIATFVHQTAQRGERLPRKPPAKGDK